MDAAQILGNWAKVGADPSLDIFERHKMEMVKKINTKGSITFELLKFYAKQHIQIISISYIVDSLINVSIPEYQVKPGEQIGLVRELALPGIGYPN